MIQKVYSYKSAASNEIVCIGLVIGGLVIGGLLCIRRIPFVRRYRAV